jgi:hypothetical protein
MKRKMGKKQPPRSSLRKENKRMKILADESREKSLGEEKKESERKRERERENKRKKSGAGEEEEL